MDRDGTPYVKPDAVRSDPDPVPEPNLHPSAPEDAVQFVLADLIDDPGRQILPWIQTRFPGREGIFYAITMRGVRALIDEVVGGLQKSSSSEPSPTLLDRLSFSWRILRKGDVLIWKTKKVGTPTGSTRDQAASIFQNILSVPLQEPLLAALLRGLRLGDDARYLSHYSMFRKAKSPNLLLPPFGNIAKHSDADRLRTLIWWCIRARREEYIEVRPKEPVRIEFAFVIEKVVEDLKGWCGTEIEQLSDLTGEVERELNAWLSYSRLEPSSDDNVADGVDPELAKAFIKHNELTTKLLILRAPGHSEQDEKISELEALVRQYAAENRVLEDLVGSLKNAPPTTPVASIDSSVVTDSLSELREVLKTIDTKYSFDALNSVQLGEQTHLTLRSFVSHLFYALRKKGLSEYPKDEEFDLTYEASGLYDCDGFEVPPSGKVQVKVTRRGWALNSRGKWLPIRRARVVMSNAHQ